MSRTKNLVNAGFILVLVLLVLQFINVCLCENVCNHLNAIYEQKVGPHYQQLLRDVQPINDNTVLALQIYEDVDPSTIQPRQTGTSLMRISIMNGERDMVLKQHSYFTVEKDLDKDTPILKDVSDAKLFAISNIFNVSFEGGSIEQRSVLSVTAPRKDVKELSKIHFALIDSNSKTSFNTFEDNETFEFEYPLPTEGDRREKVYNEKGEVIRDQQINENSTSIQTEHIPQGNIRALSTAAYQSKGSETAVFAVLVLSQDSLKLVKYTADVKSGSLVVTKKSQEAVLVMPRVIVQSDPTAHLNFTLGGRVGIQNNDQILVLLHIHRDQAAAFTAVSGFPISFKDEQISAPFLLRYSSNLQLLSVDNLVQNLKDVPPRVYVFGMDTRGDYVVISGNTRSADPQQKRNPSDDQRAFFSRVKYNNETLKSEEVLSGYLPIAQQDPKFPQANMRFFAQDISFAIDQNMNRFVIGGAVGAYEQPYDIQGLIGLVAIDETDKSASVIYRLHVGEQGANAVYFIRRTNRILIPSERNEPELFITGNLMDGPSNPPPLKDPAEDPFRSVKVGFWQVNCKPRNIILEQAVTYTFFGFFSVVCFIFALVVLGYTIKGIILFVQERSTN